MANPRRNPLVKNFALMGPGRLNVGAIRTDSLVRVSVLVMNVQMNMEKEKLALIQGLPLTEKEG